MAYAKTIVCLASSLMRGGRLIAGKDDDGVWIRPISVRPTTELAASEYTYADGTAPELLDLVEIEFEKPAPRAHQTENHVIAAERWRKRGTLAYRDLAGLVDSDLPIWGSGDQTPGGINDCTAAQVAAKYDHSLCLVKPMNLHVRVGVEGRIYQKLTVRAFFTHRGADYALEVTDPTAETAFWQRGIGNYRLDAYVCISLTAPGERDDRCHKLAAALVSEELLSKKGTSRTAYASWKTRFTIP